MAAYTAVPPLPKHVAFTYYKRARKAVLQAIDKPSLQTVQAFYFINLFAQWNGQPSIGRPFFKSALDMLLLLQLDIDPDDSPWLYPLKLTDRQKEERRRVFWCCYWFLTLEQATTSDAVQIQLSTNRIRPPRPIEGVFKGFILQTCESQSLIAEIRRHHSKAPKSLVDILGSESIITLNSRLIQVHQQFPAEYLLIAENAENLSTLDYSRFLGQLSSILKTDVAYICTLNLNILASVCMLHRPKLYLSAVKHLDPEKLNDEARVLISSALSHSIDSAHRALCLLGFYLDVMEGSARERLPVDQRLYFSSQIVLTQLNVYPIFEVMIVFWFFVCRTRPCWRRYSAVGISNVPLLLERLVGLVSFVKRVFAAEKNTPGTMEPILKCMEAMVAEMSNLVAGQGATEFSSNNDVADLELGMKVMALGEQEEDSAVPIITQEPCAFLGLLGMEVAGGIRWKGRSEEAWRLFWKLNS
ncbi:hypothetical protein BCR33DRAFT_211461 [Rhizoclosmatium globosum]|uniref:Xylanolytic transcriptional activator regulatory domain-containing protein n=1 Tax=Rhizoclosmatium globosum TaxID=329046 RepID=A0A1Y2CCU9_9FUNG|nr:hypothetical protein BCR33DRAFT_211461 [Rhizoclosmatium globosum]|eukprot:ORY44870.1 hypothetical protein BCR33DRAFT_211461 [Rhizoclosmatium globosum]